MSLAELFLDMKSIEAVQLCVPYHEEMLRKMTQNDFVMLTSQSTLLSGRRYRPAVQGSRAGHCEKYELLPSKNLSLHIVKL